MTEYVRGHVHTNGIENFWSLLKRAIRERFGKDADRYGAIEVISRNPRLGGKIPGTGTWYSTMDDIPHVPSLVIYDTFNEPEDPSQRRAHHLMSIDTMS